MLIGIAPVNAGSRMCSALATFPFARHQLGVGAREQVRQRPKLIGAVQETVVAHPLGLEALALAVGHPAAVDAHRFGHPRTSLYAS